MAACLLFQTLFMCHVLLAACLLFQTLFMCCVVGACSTVVEFVYPAVCDDWKVNFMKYIFVYYAVCLSNCSSSRDAAKNLSKPAMLLKWYMF